MVEKTYTMIDEAGIHARPSTALVGVVTKFKSEEVFGACHHPIFVEFCRFQRFQVSLTE
ncbi:HPr family phosphocarrier protein [Metabacillus litoralis]|uniref:HPr family phosphocarrier protein n=1 Tax=Metabacillus litoralis TaxID=152268 RepID=UPI00203B4913|nr:HPr family phosphocarrier protein [Metabacillus litoralis]MCM3410305.1 HPr family phosphocarrier protein [Metabacillus litoralis]